MARIRCIKPEFSQSESMGRVTRDARLLFILLWTICDDSGRTRAASRMLASVLFPYDDDANKFLPSWLAELQRERCIRLYEIDGNSYLQITNWHEHQKIDRPSKSKIPPPPQETIPNLKHPREYSRGLDEPSSLEGKGRDLEREGKGNGSGREGKGSASALCARARDSGLDSHNAPEGTTKGTRWQPDAVVPAEWISEACELLKQHQLPETDMALEAERFANYWSAKSGSAGCKSDWRKTWFNWVTNPSVHHAKPNGAGHDDPVIAQLKAKWAKEDAEAASQPEARK